MLILPRSGREVKPNDLICGGLLLIAAALALTGYNLWEDQRAAQAARQALAAMEVQTETEGERAPEQPEPSVPEYVLHPDMEMPTVEINGVEYIGTLAIPTLGLELPIVSSWSDALLDLAPCRYTGSAYLGDLIIAGHNYRGHFGSLYRLAPGDEVQFTDTAGNVFSYGVSEIQELPGTALEEMEAGDWDLTLFTCTLSRTSRVTVRCERTGTSGDDTAEGG